MTRQFSLAVIAIAQAAAWTANAQGTLEIDHALQLNQPLVFTAHLTGNTSYTGDGTFSLSGNVLSYRVVTDLGFDQAEIYGPALPGDEGPLIFTLTLTYCEAPKPDGTPTYCVFSGRPPGSGAFTLSNEQITDLAEGRWYVAAGAQSSLRGQILQVPEPSTAHVLLAGVTIWTFVRWRRVRAKILARGSE